MSRANDALMDAIHGLVAGSLKDELERAAWRASQPPMIDGEDAEGNPKKVKNPEYEPLSPQLIDKARAFLKDNGIDAPARSEKVDSLAHTLRDLDVDEIAHDIHTAH